MSATNPAPDPAQRPISLKQLEANRRSAQRSTGPKTPEGKARVSQNAITHGGYASIRAINRGHFREDQAELQAIVDGIKADLQPRNLLEDLTANQVDDADGVVGVVLAQRLYGCTVKRSCETPPLSGPVTGDANGPPSHAASGSWWGPVSSMPYCSHRRARTKQMASKVPPWARSMTSRQ